MEQFNLDTWLQDKNRKVVTSHGNPVRIVCWDRKHDFPIIALEECDNKEFIHFVTSDGKIDLSGLEDNHDLFFADEEKCNKILNELKSYLKNTPKEQIEKDWQEIQDWYSQNFAIEKCNEEVELTEFEKLLKELIEDVQNDDYIEEIFDFWKDRLLYSARKELEKEYRIVDKDDSNWEDGYKRGYKQGKQDTEKDLLKLEKSNACIDPTIPVMYTNAASMKTYVEYDGYKLCINDAFEKLSKEE